MHVLKVGCRWVDCPKAYGPHNTIYQPSEPAGRRARSSRHTPRRRAPDRRRPAPTACRRITKGGQADFPRELAEAALAHVTRDKAERAYRRGDAFKKRRQLMAEWAAFVGAL
jgi:hypothetical protein